jgi:hypothetical protein
MVSKLTPGYICRICSYTSFGDKYLFASANKAATVLRCSVTRQPLLAMDLNDLFNSSRMLHVYFPPLIIAIISIEHHHGSGVKVTVLSHPISNNCPFPLFTLQFSNDLIYLFFIEMFTDKNSDGLNFLLCIQFDNLHFPVSVLE